MANQTPRSMLSVFELVFVIFCIAFITYLAPARHDMVSRCIAGVALGLPMGMFPRLLALIFARGRGGVWVIGCIIAFLFLFIVGLLGGFQDRKPHGHERGNAHEDAADLFSVRPEGRPPRRAFAVFGHLRRAKR